MKITLAVSIIVACIFLFASCTNKLPEGNTSNSNQVPANEFGKKLSLKFGESILVGKENLKISFVDLKDSRCPKEVNCMTEGKAKVQLQIEAKDLNETVELIAKGLCYKMDGSCGNEVMAGPYKVKLFNVNPYPLKKTGSKESNVVAFEVSK